MVFKLLLLVSMLLLFSNGLFAVAKIHHNVLGMESLRIHDTVSNLIYTEFLFATADFATDLKDSKDA